MEEVNKYKLISFKDNTEVTVEDNIEGGRRPAVTLLREEDTRTVRYYTPKY